MTVQPDGKILVGSDYSFSQPTSSIRRLNADGSVDNGFVPPIPSSGGGPFVVLPSGKILAGGYYSNADASITRPGMARLNADGSFDLSFTTGTDGYFDVILPQPDGRILVAGLFLRIGVGNAPTPRSEVALLNADGSLVTSFDVGANGEVIALATQSDGKIIAGGSFTKMGGGGSGVTVRNNLARFSLPPAPPTMTLDRMTLQFSAVTTGAAFTSKTGTQTIRLTQSGNGTVTWTAAANQPWLSVSPTSGTGSATLNVSVQFVAGLAAASNGSIALTLTGAGNSAGPIAVTLMTLAGAAAGAPVGAFDTPSDGATGVAGSIGVTGWVIDDVQVTRVRILRDPVAGETPGVQVYIGDAVFVDGARPDIQNLYPTRPLNTRAGWGYLMLTNFLPSLGNGTFKIYAYADDADGHTTLLGSKTITCTNSTAVAPFGAIDTPAQGEVIGGASYNNFGWVLSPGARRADVPGGGTVTVLVDGVSVGSPVGWTARPDLTALFPSSGYSGVGSAAAVFGLNTTGLANGVHTISWIVTATSGGTSGVGSRFFTVSNGALYADPGQGSFRSTSWNVIASGRAGVGMRAAEIDAAPVDRRGILGRRGFDLNAPLHTYRAEGDRVVVQAEELDRIELHLAGPGVVVGYLRAGVELAPLPIGSTLDPTTGTFTWMPGVAFIGSYDLVFTRTIDGPVVARQDVRVVLNPRGTNRVGPQVVIDAPSAGATVSRTFVLGGWAADLDADVGSGVDTIHVWAYPRTTCDVRPCDPIFLGAAAYGGDRPDVAAIFGSSFRNSGYGLSVDSLPPGTYDIAVFAWSTVAGGFVPAKVVRVTVK